MIDFPVTNVTFLWVKRERGEEGARERVGRDGEREREREREWERGRGRRE